MIFDASTKDKETEIKQAVKTGIKAACVYANKSSLDTIMSTIFVKLSLDNPQNWTNGYIENSRYMQFTIDQNGTIEQFVKSYKIAKNFRKQHAKNLIDAVNRINKYLESIE